MTGGVRVGQADFKTAPPLNQIVFTEYGRHTSSVPPERRSARRALGFNWDITGDQSNQLRGGIGSFSGPPPFVYLSNAFGNSGLSGFSTLTCDGNTARAPTSRAAPAFTHGEHREPADGLRAGQRAHGVHQAGAHRPRSAPRVNTIDPDFKFPKYLKASLGFDHRFSTGCSRECGTVEGLYTRSQQNAFYQNLALDGPEGTDSQRPRAVRHAARATRRHAGHEGQPHAGARRDQLVGRLHVEHRRSSSRSRSPTELEGSIAYTYQQARDVVSMTSSTAGSNYRYQRSTSGRLDDKSVTRSKYDQPHRIIATGTYRFPTLTDVSVIYSGGSGAPYRLTCTARRAARRAT